MRFRYRGGLSPGVCAGPEVHLRTDLDPAAPPGGAAGSSRCNTPVVLGVVPSSALRIPLRLPMMLSIVTFLPQLQKRSATQSKCFIFLTEFQIGVGCELIPGWLLSIPGGYYPSQVAADSSPTTDAIASWTAAPSLQCHAPGSMSRFECVSFRSGPKWQFCSRPVVPHERRIYITIRILNCLRHHEELALAPKAC